jgi:hypothetical protein
MQRRDTHVPEMSTRGWKVQPDGIVMLISRDFYATFMQLHCNSPGNYKTAFPFYKDLFH